MEGEVAVGTGRSFLKASSDGHRAVVPKSDPGIEICDWIISNSGYIGWESSSCIFFFLLGVPGQGRVLCQTPSLKNWRKSPTQIVYLLLPFSTQRGS